MNNEESTFAQVEAAAQEILGGPGRTVNVAPIGSSRSAEITVKMRTGFVHGPLVIWLPGLEDVGRTPTLRERLEAWRDSDFASDET